jgi:hypothetical protein
MRKAEKIWKRPPLRGGKVVAIRLSESASPDNGASNQVMRLRVYALAISQTPWPGDRMAHEVTR